MLRSWPAGWAPPVTRDKGSSPLTVVDWRHVDAALLAQCYRLERAHWREVLRWETAWTWAMVERARVTWGLPGFAALDRNGRVRGWSFQLVEHATVRIGGIVADSEEVTARLVERILDHAREVKAEIVSCFVAERAPGLSTALAATGFDCEPFDYLTCDLPSTPAVARVGDAEGTTAEAAKAGGAGASYEPWDHDVVAAADLFAAAYDAKSALHFTTSGTLDEWRTYVRQLVEQPACGSLDETGTMMLRDRQGLAALALVTTLAPDTAHLAQIAVRPDCQGRGLARQMVTEALARAAAQRRRAMTLLVAGSNAAARHLYERAGFRRTARFVAGRVSLRSSVAIIAPRSTAKSQQRS